MPIGASQDQEPKKDPSASYRSQACWGDFAGSQSFKDINISMLVGAFWALHGLLDVGQNAQGTIYGQWTQHVDGIFINGILSEKACDPNHSLEKGPFIFQTTSFCVLRQFSRAQTLLSWSQKETNHVNSKPNPLRVLECFYYHRYNHWEFLKFPLFWYTLHETVNWYIPPCPLVI